MGMTLKISKEISQVNICEKDVLSRGKNRSAGPKVGQVKRPVWSGETEAGKGEKIRGSAGGQVTP